MKNLAKVKGQKMLEDKFFKNVTAKVNHLQRISMQDSDELESV